MPRFPDAGRYSLADFHHNANPDLLSPPDDFEAWMADERVRAGYAFFQQPFLGAAGARAEILSSLDGRRRPVINLTSYNYLGLSTHPEVIRAVQEGVARYGLSVSGSPMVSGTTDLHVQLAARLAALKGQEDCLVFSSGYGGNVGAIQGIMRKGDIVIMDERGHKSLIDGVVLSGAKLVCFAHNDMADLDAKLAAHRGRRCLVVAEGVYSMDGDLVRLPELVAVCEAHKAAIYLDEAHSSLVFGAHGGGVAEHFGLADRIGIAYGTLSKSFGGIGGFICTRRKLVRYLRGYASAWNFSCAASPAVVAGLLKALEIATRDSAPRDRLWANTAYFRAGLEGLGLDLGASASQIIPLIIGSSGELLFRLAADMQLAGLFLQPIDYPAVPAHSRRFRISLNSELRTEDMDRALNIIEDVVVRGLRREGLA
jgi:glycine C-acetyltransferase